MTQAPLNEFELDRQRLARRRAIAEAQAAESMKMDGNTQVVSGIAVPNYLGPVAKIVQAYMAKQGIADVDDQEKTLAQDVRNNSQQALERYNRAISPRAAVAGAMQEDASGNVYRTDDQPAYAPGATEKRSAAMDLLGSSGGDPRDISKLIVADALKGPKLADINPKDYTPESFATYQKTGDVTALRAAPKENVPPAALKEYEYAKAQGYTGDFNQWLLEQKRAGATNVTVSTGKKYGEAFASKVADSDMGMLDAARKAPDLAERANRVLSTVAGGKVITGAGADYRLALGKALNLAGASDAQTIANTEALSTDLAKNTLDAIKASGLGSGSGFSNADRDFLEKAVGGKITLEGETIKRLASLAHRAAEKSATAWSTRVKDIPEDALTGTGIRRDAISVPAIFSGGAAATPKANISPEVAAFLKANGIPVPGE